MSEKDKPIEEEAQTLEQMYKELNQYATDLMLITQMKKDYEELKLETRSNPDLELFTLQYENMHHSLEESLQQEQFLLKKCRELAAEIVTKSAELDGFEKNIKNTEEAVMELKKALNDRKNDIEKIKEEKIQCEVEIEKTSKLLELRQEKQDEEVHNVEQQLMNEKQQKQKSSNEQQAMIEDLNSQIKNQRSEVQIEQQQLDELVKQATENRHDIGKLNNQIQEYKDATVQEEQRHDKMNTEMVDLKTKLDKSKDNLEEKIKDKDRIIEEIGGNNIKLLNKMKEKDEKSIQQRENAGQIQTKENDLEYFKNQLEKISDNIKDLEQQKVQKENEKDELEHVVAHLLKQEEKLTREKGRVQLEKKYFEDTKLSKEETEQIHLQAVDKQKKLMDDLKEEVDIKLKERSQNNKNLKKAEDEDHNIDEDLIHKLNNLKKIENQVLGYEVENEKLEKMIIQLQKEQEKYGIEASQAHAKYYQTIEEVKIKNNQITELQKKNAEVEAKLKHQQNLYEAVRSDRNLYSKNLLESQEEIQELMKKYTRMTHQVDQFKEEIKQKDSQLVKEDFEFNKIVEENKKTKLEKKRVKKAIKSTEEVIKNQEQHISRLKYIIQEAKAEKQRQEKDLEMVINERDILGTQLIKRNHELNILYEKIKLSQSNLAKGEIFYREKQNQLESLKKELTLLVNELKGTKSQISCLDDLKNEINNLEKDILSEKTKVKALEDELQNPLNVHRWRKLEATDTDNFEKILKIQTLQRRLIAKTEEVQEKDNLIKEKEKLFMELKNILARQPGAEIHQQLQSYKESLKDKQSQMKKMLAELKNSQESVDLLKFENNRLRDELSQMKKQYFRRRKDDDYNKEQRQMNIQNPQQQQGYNQYQQNFSQGQKDDLGQGGQGMGGQGMGGQGMGGQGMGGQGMGVGGMLIK